MSRINPDLPVSASNLKYDQGSGDFSASGYNFDLPNVMSGVTPQTDRFYLKRSGTDGIFPGCQSLAATCVYFAQPSFGQLGNETPNGQFRNPNFAQTDVSLKKNTKVFERLTLHLRVDAFNVFDQVNFNNVHQT